MANDFTTCASCGRSVRPGDINDKGKCVLCVPTAQPSTEATSERAGSRRKSTIAVVNDNDEGDPD